MPELPEVETIRRQLAPLVVGAEIADAAAHPSAKFAPAVEATGSEITEVDRRGKYLLLALDGPAGRELVVHLGMTGRLAVEPEFDAAHPHLRARWTFADGRTLTFHDTRRFGRIHVVDAGDHTTIPTLHALGPEPFDPAFDGRSLHAALGRSTRHVKTQLLSQRPVAGVGNIYADEALWLARINPVARRISRPRADRLADAIRTVLRSGLDHGGTTLRDYVDAEGDTGANQHELRCYGRAGEPCERCGDVLRRRELDTRGTTWCPTCQRR